MKELGIQPYSSMCTSLQSNLNPLYIFKLQDGLSTSTGFILHQYGHSRTYWTIFLLEGSSPRCRSSVNNRRNSLHGWDPHALHELFHKKNMENCNVQLFVKSKATRNQTTDFREPSHKTHKQYCEILMGNVKSIYRSLL